MTTTEKPEKQYRQLPVDLTPAEKITKGLEQARVRDVIREVRGERDEAMDKFKGRLKALETERDRLTDEIRDGREMRAVEVREERNYRQNTLREIRVDTGEVVRTRPMTKEEREERQIDLFSGGGAKRTPPPGNPDRYDMRAAIIDAVRDAPNPISKRAICAVVTGTDAEIRRVVDELVGEGVLVMRGGRFAAPGVDALPDVEQPSDETTH